jgi:putative ABC transport system permease protein
VTPPRLVHWLWNRLAPARVRDDVLGDLDEEYRSFKRPQLGAVRAGLWYSYQVVTSLFALHTKYRARRKPLLPPPGRDGDRSWSTSMNSLLQDVGYSVRTLRKAPGFTLVAVATLALGIGATSAIFSVLNAVLLAPLPYDDPEELVVVGGQVSGGGSQDLRASGPEYRDYLEAASLSELAAAYVIDANITNGEEPARMSVALITPSFFPLFRNAPALGRDFEPEDAGVDIGYVMVLSHAAWQRLFGADTAALGQTVQIDEDPITVVGVMPEGFTHPGVHASPIEAWVPFDPTSATFGNRRYRPLDVYGRLAKGVSRAESQAEFRAIAEGLREAYPDVYGFADEWSVEVASLLDRVVGNVRPTLLVLFGSVVFVLLIACTNVANLVLTRGTTRARELAVRSAMGGSRMRIARQLLIESLVLALAGGAAGLLVAQVGVDVLRRLAAEEFPRIGQATIDGNVLLFTLLASAAASVVFGLAPTWRLSKPDFRQVLAESGRGTSASRSRMRDGLVVAQISISLVLVISAGLMIKSFARLLAVDPGFDPARVLAMQVWLPRPNVPETGRFYRMDQRVTLFDRAIERMEALPEVVHAAVVSHLPLRNTGSAPFLLEGMDMGDRREPLTAEYRIVSPEYFEIMGIPLTQGRTVEFEDDSDGPLAVVVSESLARRYSAGEDPVGRRLQLGNGGPWWEIVGVVGDVRQQALDVSPRPTIYLSYRQNVGRSMTFVLKTAGPPEPVAQRATEALQQVDRDLPVYAVASMQDVIGDTVSQRRMLMVLLSLFAAQALILAAIGVYGVIAYATRRRNREIGIRIALGADRRAVLGMVLRHGVRLGFVGACIGIGMAAGVTRLLEGFLFEVGELDPLVFTVMALLAVGIAALAAWLPARRATRVHPAEVLRAE